MSRECQMLRLLLKIFQRSMLLKIEKTPSVYKLTFYGAWYWRKHLGEELQSL